MVGEDAVQEAQAKLGLEVTRGSLDQVRADLQVAEHPALFGQAELGAVGELANLSDVMDESCAK